MKKLLKPTLGRKVFILLLVSFCFVNVLNILLDFSKEKNHAYESLTHSYVNGITNQLFDDFDNLDDSFFQRVHKILNQEGTHYQDALILDNQWNIVYNDQSQEPASIIVFNLGPDLKTSGVDTYRFNLPTLDESVKNDLEKNLKKITRVKIASQDYSQRKDDERGFYDTSYLSIDNHVIFDHRENQEELVGFDFYAYKSDNIYISIQEFYPWDEKFGYNELNYQEIRNTAIESIKDKMTNEIEAFVSYGNEFEKDNTLYSVNCYPIVSKNVQMNSEGKYSFEDIQGYFIYYNYDFHAIDRIINDVILSKVPAYVVSFVFVIILCLLLSYMLTKRIKKINQSALMIASNQFDVHLKEKPDDELGTLSHNINHMSERLKQTIEQLNDEIDRVKHLESLRKEFIANFTHEIKTPLGIINGYIELIDMGNDEEKKQKYLLAINQETDRINVLVKSMLDLSRIETGHVELSIQDIDIEDMLSSIIDTFAPLLEKKQVKIIMEGEFSQVQADAQEMSIVLKNLISNAIKHTPQNGHVYISLKDKTFMIENEGEHISDQQKEKIWDTYVSSDREGTGLGLAICKAILDLHEFSYYVDNTKKGVCFTIHMSK